MLNTPAIGFDYFDNILACPHHDSAVSATSIPHERPALTPSLFDVPVTAPTSRTCKPLGEILHQFLALRYRCFLAAHAYHRC